MVLAVSAKAGLPFIDLGVKFGVSNLDHDFNSNRIGQGSNVYGFKVDDKVGWHIGGQARVNLMMFHIQPEILFSHNAYTMNLAHDSNTGMTASSKVKVNTIDVPVLFGVKMMIFRFQAGPMFTIMADGKTSGGYVRDVTLSKPSASYLIGIGADLSRFNVDVRYNGHFSRTKQTFLVDNVGSTHRSKDNGLTFSLGYMF